MYLPTNSCGTTDFTEYVPDTVFGIAIPGGGELYLVSFGSEDEIYCAGDDTIITYDDIVDDSTPFDPNPGPPPEEWDEDPNSWTLTLARPDGPNHDDEFVDLRGGTGVDTLTVNYTSTKANVFDKRYIESVFLELPEYGDPNTIVLDGFVRTGLAGANSTATDVYASIEKMNDYEYKISFYNIDNVPVIDIIIEGKLDQVIFDDQTVNEENFDIDP